MSFSHQMKTWFESYFQAIESQDADAFAAHFSENATYEIVDPFQEWLDYGVYLEGRAAIHEFFDGLVKNSRNFRMLGSEVLSTSPKMGIAHLKLSWLNKSTNEDYACDYIILVRLDSHNLCTSIRDWSRVRSRA